MDLLLFIKLAISIATVLGLSWLTERVSPRLAGLLSGYPIGTAIALFFIGIENGSGFAAEAAVYTVAGLAATVTYSAGYYYGSLPTRGPVGVMLAVVAGLGAFFAASSVLRPFDWSLVTAVLPPACAMLFYSWLFRRLPDHRINRTGKAGMHVYLVRALLSAAVVVAITGTAHLVGPAWAGLFSAFPITVMPLLAIIHWSHGREPVHAFIRNVPRGLGALLTYCGTVHVTYAALGVAAGTLISFGTATVYRIIYRLISLGAAKRIKPDIPS